MIKNRERNSPPRKVDKAHQQNSKLEFRLSHLVFPSEAEQTITLSLYFAKSLTPISFPIPKILPAKLRTRRFSFPHHATPESPKLKNRKGA